MTSKNTPIARKAKVAPPVVTRALRGIDVSKFEHRPQGPTKSAMIRALAANGYNMAAIARELKIQYQFVWNVLNAPVTTGKPGRPKKVRPNA